MVLLIVHLEIHMSKKKNNLDTQAVQLVVEKFAEIIQAAKNDKISDLDIGAALAVVVAMVAGDELNLEAIVDYAKRNLAVIQKKAN